MKLKSKIFLIILGNILIPSIIFTFIYLPYQKEFADRVIEKDKLLLKTLVKRDENPIANELYDKSKKAMRIRLKEMLSVNGIISISIFDAEKKLFLTQEVLKNHKHTHHFDHKITVTDFDQNRDHFKMIQQEHHKLIRYTHEIHAIGEKLGYIQIYFSIDEIELLKTRGLKLFLFLLAGIIISFVFLINFSLTKLVLNPVTKLRDLMLKIGTGDLKQQIDIRRDDEIGDLSKAFNSMSNELTSSYLEIKRQHQEIHDIQIYLKSIIDSLSSMLIAVNQNTKITEVNQSAIDNFSTNYELVIGKKICDFIPRFIAYKPNVLSVIESGLPEMHREVILNDTPSTYFNITIFPLQRGENNGAVILIEDVSEMHQKDEQLKQAQKMEIIGTLAGGIAHDFNNVLSGIVGTTSILKFSMENNKFDELLLSKSINTIENSADRASELVKQLLTVSKKQNLSLQNIDLHESIQNVINICKNSFDKSIEIMTDFSKTPARINADPSQIEQVILNICLNAAHSMTIMGDQHQWGGKLTLSTKQIPADESRSTVHANAKESNYWHIAISDTGIGIDESIIDKIFDPFFTTKEHGDGTGLGLSMSYRTISQHNGFIHVSSKKGVGTNFDIFLPEVKTKLSHDSSQKITTFDHYHGHGTILIVDDEMIVREMAKSILEECGYDVILAEDGHSGVLQYIEHKDIIRAVLLDLLMPKMHGNEVFAKIKEVTPNVKVLMASGFINDERAQEALKMGVKSFIQKPYTFETLSSEIYNVINND